MVLIKVFSCEWIGKENVVWVYNLFINRGIFVVYKINEVSGNYYVGRKWYS